MILQPVVGIDWCTKNTTRCFKRDCLCSGSSFAKDFDSRVLEFAARVASELYAPEQTPNVLLGRP